MHDPDRDTIGFLLGVMEGALVHLAYEFAKTDRAAAVDALRLARTAIDAQVSKAEASGRIDPNAAALISSQIVRVIAHAQSTIGQAFH